MAIQQYCIKNLDVYPRVNEKYRYGPYAGRSVDYEIVSYLVKYTLEENSKKYKVIIRISAEDYIKHATLYFTPKMFCLTDRVTEIVQQYESIRHRKHSESTFLRGEIAKTKKDVWGCGGLQMRDIQVVCKVDISIRVLQDSINKIQNELAKLLKTQESLFEQMKDCKNLGEKDFEEMSKLQVKTSSKFLELNQQMIILKLELDALSKSD